MTSVIYREFKPTEKLAPFIECYWQLEGSSNNEPWQPELILPDGRTELIFNLAEPMTRIENSLRIDAGVRSYFVGQSVNSVCVEPQGTVHLFGVCFKSCGAFPFFKFPQRELSENIVGLDMLWGNLAESLEYQIHSATTLLRRINTIESFLLKRLEKSQPNNNRTVIGAICQITDSKGKLRIEKLADTLGTSRRRLEKEFAALVGISPKSLSRITRFQNVFRSINNLPNVDLADTVFNCGYFDQSHLIRDFQHFCGQSPIQYLEKKHILSENFRADNRGAHFSNTI